ncbi:hypothetical protein ABZ614_10760 [Streptomyces sp. NPDC013178]|uniref:hypothetical protein n=1 Tax=unclassified Streptomyces TaxID=2593676 RepID=UPI003401348C
MSTPAGTGSDDGPGGPFRQVAAWAWIWRSFDIGPADAGGPLDCTASPVARTGEKACVPARAHAGGDALVHAPGPHGVDLVPPGPTASAPTGARPRSPSAEAAHGERLPAPFAPALRGWAGADRDGEREGAGEPNCPGGLRS